MGKRHNGRRRAAGDSSVSLFTSSAGSTDHQKSSSGKSTAHQPTRLSQQSGAVGEEASPPPPRRSPMEDTAALRRSLLGLIRYFYIDAISRLPTADLRTTLARGLLVGGHCYGALHPVDNIITNSVWYNAAFPLRPEDRVEVDVICSKGTDRAARRSLDGLIACLVHVCPFLSPVEALWQLIRSRADLRVAVAGISAASGSGSIRCARPSALRSAERELVKAAFEMAAAAARHPNPAAFALFASSVLPDVEPDISRLIAKHSLSSLDIRRLSTVLLHYPLPNRLPPPDPSPKVSQLISENKRGATKRCHSLLQIVDAALCKFASKTGIHYELHTIYGDSLLEDECYNRYYHINFMVQRKEDHSSSSDAGPGCCLFFFAGAPRHHHIREEDISICCLVEPSPPDVDNCHTCLMLEHKIDHPASDPIDHAHDLLISGQCYEIGAINHEWDFQRTLGVDYLFFDSYRDSGLVEHLHNYFARIDAFCAGLSDDEDDAPQVGNYCRILA